jgi:hypothetical protein
MWCRANARTPDTPVRCLFCRHEAAIEEWRHAPVAVSVSGRRPSTDG